MNVVLEDSVTDPLHGLNQPELRGDVFRLLLILGVAVASLNHGVTPLGLRVWPSIFIRFYSNISSYTPETL